MKEKLDLEREKLNLEILNLKRSWWKKPEYITLLISLVLGLLTFGYAISNGLLDIRNQNLELKKKNLQFDIKQYTVEKEKAILSFQSIEDSVNILKSINQTLELKYVNLNSKYEKDKSIILTENKQLKQELQELSENKEYQDLYFSLNEKFKFKDSQIQKLENEIENLIEIIKEDELSIQILSKELNFCISNKNKFSESNDSEKFDITIKTRRSQFEFVVSDSSNSDGDIFDIYHNSKLIVSNLVLNKRPKKITLSLEDGDNIVEIKAKDLGKIAPATLLFGAISDRGKTTEIKQFDLGLNQSKYININKK